MGTAKYYIAQTGEFVIEDYNQAPSFASFFPGIAGIYGSPMWVFYANRGQCITSAGVHNKDSAILEFQPANKAYRSAALDGFRTFLKVDGSYYEPFAERSPHKKEMRIAAHSLKLVEENQDLKLKVEVEYFTVPHEHFPALARRTRVVNLAGASRQVEIIDGLPIIVPYGFSNDLLKRISHTIEAWSIVENLENRAPFYKLRVLPADVSETRYLEKGNFFISFAYQDGKQKDVDLIIDPFTVFGELTGLGFPDNFADGKAFHIPKHQLNQGFMPCAFAHRSFQLKSQAAFELFSYVGQIDSLDLLNRVRERVSTKDYYEGKAAENRELIDDICSRVNMQSSSRALDLYARQTFLDNTMRGGLPVNIGGKVIYVYYRKHGDMERDYNDFELMPTYLSQGSGNYRDINQNRRCDIYFNPRVAEDNILRFFNLIQLDGFNPLVVMGSRFQMSSEEDARILLEKHLQDTGRDYSKMLVRPFILGAFVKELEENGASYKTSRDDFVRELTEHCSVKEGAIHGEGYWIDHFSYNTDLLESFGAIYPDRIRDVLLNEKIFTFYDNTYIVLDRKHKYHRAGDRVRQYECVRSDQGKTDMIFNRHADINKVRAGYGRGDIYQVTLLAKVLSIIANKAASFDAEGIGLEMEADKPDWYDALNGLPALFGSSLSETLELKRLCLYLRRFIPAGFKLHLAEEIKGFIDELSGKMDKHFASGDAFRYWDTAAASKESFRHHTRFGVSGQEITVDGNYILAFLDRVVKKCDDGVGRCLKKYGNYFTYFINDAVGHELDSSGKVRITRFKQQPLPLFLEGFVHALKVNRDKKIYEMVKQSPLYDRKLKMYKVNAPLNEAPIEIGRTRIFTPGWLENESVWLHMEYKYMLELLRAGMYDEFFSDFKEVFVPFMDPQRYKRSTLENSSFIASSAHPDQGNHGRGFVARLSGGAAEFIDIWIHMTSGKDLFSLDDKGKLCFKLSPVLPAWLFADGKFAFTLLGSIEVTYLNASGKNTYNSGVSPKAYKLTLDGKEIEIDQPFVAEPYSARIREGRVSKMTVTLA